VLEVNEEDGVAVNGVEGDGAVGVAVAVEEEDGEDGEDGEDEGGGDDGEDGEDGGDADDAVVDEGDG